MTSGRKDEIGGLDRRSLFIDVFDDPSGLRTAAS